MLERPVSSIVWELRTAWASRREIVLSLTERCEPDRMAGRLQRVSPTGAFVVIEGRHIPSEDILAVHRPHFSQREAA